MEKPPVNSINKAELPKAEQSVEHFSLSEQEKNIQEVFKLSPELENIVIKATKSGETISLYRIENKNIEKEPDGITSHKDLKGQWFSPDLETTLTYLRKSQQTFGAEAKRVEGTNLVVVKIPKEEFENLHVSKHPIASQMDVENDNYIVPENIERNYINLDDVQDKVGNFENFQKAKKQVEEKVKKFETKEAIKIYENYLKTIFPESKIKNIVWHGTTNRQELIDSDFDEKRKSKEYDYSHGAIFATSSIEDAETAGTGKGKYDIVPLVINIENLGISREGKINKEDIDNLPFSSEDEINKIIQESKENWNKLGWKYKILPNNVLQLIKPQDFKHHGIWDENNNLVLDLSYNAGFIGQLKEADINILRSSGLDGVIAVDEHDLFGKQKVGNKNWYVIFEPQNTHILGSKNDIEKFKEFSSKNENKKTIQSIEQFLKENGIEHVPHIETNFLFHKHATKEDGENVAGKLDNNDILIQENAGWDKERLEVWRKISRGELNPEQAITQEKDRGKPFFWESYFKTIFKKLHGTNKEVILADIESNDELYAEMYEFMKGNSAYNDLINRDYSYDELIERIANVSELESIMQKEREDKILENMKKNLLQLFKEKPELQNKEKLNILFPVGAFHTRLYHETKKRGDNVSQEFSPSPYIFDPRMTVERKIHFLGIEKAKEDMPKILLYFLLKKSKALLNNEIPHKFLSKFSDEQIRDLFEIYKKSDSDEKFKPEVLNWITQQYKK